MDLFNFSYAGVVERLISLRRPPNQTIAQLHHAISRKAGFEEIPQEQQHRKRSRHELIHDFIFAETPMIRIQPGAEQIRSQKDHTGEAQYDQYGILHRLDQFLLNGELLLGVMLIILVERREFFSEGVIEALFEAEIAEGEDD